jgi:multimeric flavodoxin WrbA
MSVLQLIDNSDLIVLSFPLYVDSLPSQVIKFLELIADHEKKRQFQEKKYFIAIVNSGFPEASQNEIALSICRLFAKQVGFIWLGGLAKGGGEMIAGRPLDEFGGELRFQKKALDLAANAVAKGESITEEAVIFMGTLGYPRWLYTFIGNRGWKQQTKKHMSMNKIYNQPFKRNK